MGPEHSSPIQGIRYCVDRYQLPVESLTAAEIRRRYPAFCPPDDYVGCLETTAGWLDVNAVLNEMQQLARNFGAELRTDCEVTGWQSDGRTALVKTRAAEYRAKSLIIAGGAWAGKVLADLDLPLRVIRKTFAWFDPQFPNQFAEGAIPMFGFPPNSFYGFSKYRGGRVSRSLNTWGAKKTLIRTGSLLPAIGTNRLCLRPLPDICPRSQVRHVVTPHESRVLPTVSIR